MKIQLGPKTTVQADRAYISSPDILARDFTLTLEGKGKFPLRKKYKKISIPYFGGVMVFHDCMWFANSHDAYNEEYEVKLQVTGDITINT